MSFFDDLQTLPVEIIQNFRKTGKSLAIKDDLKEYIRQLDRAVEIRTASHEHNISRAAKMLQESFPQLTFNLARQRVYDAINYFHLNSSVKAEAWCNYYADRLEDLAKINIAKNNTTEARRCFERARDFRIEASQLSINPDEIKPHVFLVSPEVKPELLGLKEFNLHFLWKETKDFIEELPIDKRDKKSALIDAAGALNVEDIDFEDMDDE